MLACDEVERWMSDYEDGALPFRTRMAMRMHLAMCRSCRALERSMRETIGVLRSLKDEPVSDAAGDAGDAELPDEPPDRHG